MSDDDGVLDAPLAPGPHVIARPVQDGAMLIDVASGCTYEINQVGIRVWQSVMAAVPLRQACADLARNHGVAFDIIARDVRSFARELIRLGLVSAPAVK